MKSYLISIWRPTPLYSLADKGFERICTLASQLNLPIVTRLHETRGEIEDSREDYHLRPLARLGALDMLGPNFAAAHTVHLQEAEVDLLAQHNCAVIHCPTSNLKLGSGIASIPSLLERNVRVGLGCDGAASSSRLDLFQEMRLAAFLGKLAAGDREEMLPMPAKQVLRMATLGGAAAMGLEEKIGSLKPGKMADLCAVKINHSLELTPCYDPISHLVYSAGREHVTHTWVAGKCL